MKTRPITFAILLLLLCAMIPASRAQATEEACSSLDAVYPVVQIAILNEPSYQGVRVRYAAAGERLEIVGSKRIAWCWIQVSDGWLIDNPRALSAVPRELSLLRPSQSSSSLATLQGCFPADRAYVFGNMNIRSDSSTNSPVVANAQAGDVFEVLDTAAGADWCWLKVNLGWLAKTGRVNSTTLPIAGSSGFVRQVEAALHWMELEAPEWHHYVIGGIDKVIEFTDLNSARCMAYALTYQRQVSLETCLSNGFQQKGLSARFDQLELAVFLAHEACHIHRHEAGYVYNASTRNREESECKKPMFGVRGALDPFGRYGAVTNELGESTLSLVKRYCSEGIEDPELYCPIIRRLQGG